MYICTYMYIYIYTHIHIYIYIYCYPAARAICTLAVCMTDRYSLSVYLYAL